MSHDRPDQYVSVMNPDEFPAPYPPQDETRQLAIALAASLACDDDAAHAFQGDLKAIGVFAYDMARLLIVGINEEEARAATADQTEE